MKNNLQDDVETFNNKIIRINAIRNSGIPVQWYRTMHNKVNVKHGGVWWDMDAISKHLPEFDLNVPFNGA